MVPASPPDSTARRNASAAQTSKIAFHAGVFLISFLILFSRRPDAILNAQFYAEDGARWFADAYHMGWRCLLIPDSGYLQTVSRIIGLLSLLFPFAVAPLVMNLCALAVQILPVSLFLSNRFSNISLATRLLASLLYLALPNSFEVHGNATNVQWHLALAGLLLLLSPGKVGRGPGILDTLLLAFSVLDGAAGMLLAPVAGFLLWKRREARFKAWFLVLASGAALQTAVLLVSNSRRPAPNGASLSRLIAIVGGQIFLSATFGVRTFIRLFFGHASYLLLLQSIAMVAGIAIVAYAVVRGPLELKVFVAYATAILLLALIHPVATFGGALEQWEQLQIPGVGNRYYFFPMLAFFASLFWLATSSAGVGKFARYSAIALLMLLPIVILSDWEYKPFVDYDFKAFAAEFEKAAPGTTVSIPINPNWRLVLIKH